jgi:hypothetical protein
VSNPAFEKDGNGNYVPNAFDTTAADFSSHTLMPVERTYSEWFYSDYNTPQGVYAPQFGGNKDYVATCQDCHMRDVTGKGCNFGNPPTRNDLPLHDITGGSTWFPGLLPSLYPNGVNAQALQEGIQRARYMLQNAASVALSQNGIDLEVQVTNETGHKLPTGYPEGRRMWINVKFYDELMNLISESGAYDPNTGILIKDPEIKIYEIKPGLDEVTAPLVGVPVGPSFHFVLNNKVFKDNRIPPRGFTNASYESFGGAHVAHAYADGQHWDDTQYIIPVHAVSAEVTLYYQSTSKEFIEFLRDENNTNAKGQELYDLWDQNGKCPPEVMWTGSIQLTAEPLVADNYQLSESTGGVVNFYLDAGVVNADRAYLIFGGISGTSPGTPLPGGMVTLPINWDSVTDFILSLANTPIFNNFLSMLDGSGTASATLDTFGPLPSGTAGLTFYFAYALNAPWDFVSNPVAIEVVP